MKYKTQTLLVVGFLSFYQPLYGMHDLADIIVAQAVSENDGVDQQESVKIEDKIPLEFQDKIDPRYLHSLPYRTDALINRRSGFLPALICLSAAACLVEVENLRTLCQKCSGKKAP